MLRLCQRYKVSLPDVYRFMAFIPKITFSGGVAISRTVERARKAVRGGASCTARGGTGGPKGQDTEWVIVPL